MRKYAIYKSALKKIKKPCAFVDIDALYENMKAVTEEAKDKKIRIASKSIRSVDVIKDILAFSPVFQGLMCFTGEEALYLHDEGLDDLLIAYPIWEESVLQDICQRVTSGATITVMIDSVEHLTRLERIAREKDGHFLVCLDIDLSSKLYGIHFGVHRSPIKTVKEAKGLIDFIKQSAYTTLDGVMGYEAQIAGVTDADPKQRAKSTVIRKLKRTSAKEITKKRKKMMKMIDKSGLAVRFVNGGGTGSLHRTTKEKTVTEVTVGSGFFNSHLFDKYKDFQLEPAAGFAIEITRIPEKNIYTCFGGGYVASGATGEDKLPEIFLPEGATLTKNEGVGEVQTPIFYKGSVKLAHGDPIFFRHSKAGELCERFKTLHMIQNGKVVKTYNTYRGDGKCFL